ncbi:MAG: hypothetical protein AUG51_06860 [Acidobacteria bacterium 13_1_20CM_3_53_8]|nr:MAG: hypothetical protein AUG51_06860 [Acidobacteria bacterium 13_1_20CM_3_53_8]
MSSSPQSEQGRICSVCRAPLPPYAAHCPACGANANEAPAQALRYTLYLLSELKHWEEEGLIEPERAARLRAIYERQGDELREQIAGEFDRQRQREIARARAERRDEPQHAAPSSAPSIYTETTSDAPTPNRFEPSAYAHEPAESPAYEPRRTFIETLADPQTLRLLLYTGAAMLVVGVVIWLRDVLYLKLQEPVVQAALLVTGTVVVTAMGWFAILRTRLLLTGRALTLVGSLLVPVNFWFLVRSGLIQNHGRAWMVCALCATLYALTAAFLVEKFYVYLASAATVATLWALVYRADADAFGMYALTLMIASLAFLHLARLFQNGRAMSDEERAAALDEVEAGRVEATSGDEEEARGLARERLELWGVPLARVSVIGVVLACAMYMPQKAGTVLSLREHLFQFWAHSYDASVAALLFTMGAYVAWYLGRFVDVRRKTILYMIAVLALLWSEFLIVDGLQLSNAVQLVAVAVAAFAVSLAARVSRGLETSEAFYRAGAISSVLLVIVAMFVAVNDSDLTFTHSAALALLAASFSLLSTPRLSSTPAQIFFGYGSVFLATAAFLVAINSAHVQSRSLFVIADAAWLFALYFSSRAAASNEGQLSAPLRRTADAGILLLFLWASFIALVSYVYPEGYEASFRRAMFCAFIATILYGCLRVWRDRSRFNATIASASFLIFVAALFDSLRSMGVWPESWPIAVGVVFAAFALQDFVWRASRAGVDGDERPALDINSVVSLVADSAVVSCAALWFISALLSTVSVYERSAGACVVVVLAFCYWIKQAANKRKSWVVFTASAHMMALLLTLLIVFRVNEEWFATISVLTLFPLFFASAHFSRFRENEWITRPLNLASEGVLALATCASVIQAMIHLEVGARGMLAPAVAFGSIALVTLSASLWQKGTARAIYFRAGLFAGVMAFWLACLRAGYHPWDDVEVYTAPIGVLLLVIAYAAVRREWDDYARDAVLLSWTGSILLAWPLLIRALQFRLLFDTPAPARDLATLFISLALIIFSVFGRLRAPMLTGATTLVIELASLALTSVDWLQVPLKVYLITVGALILIIWGTLEYRREQFLAMRKKFQERRTRAREEFGMWR